MYTESVLQYNYSPEHIHLPQSLFATKMVSMISVVSAVLALVISLWVFIHGFINIDFLALIAVFVSCASAIFYRKSVQTFLGYLPTVHLVLGILIACLGVIDVVVLGVMVSPFGAVFIPIGLAIAITGLKLPHRFHVAQSILFFLCLTVSTVALYNGFRLLYPSLGSTVSLGVFLSSLAYAFLCLSLYLSKGDRGFVGMFTTDSLSSQLARRSLISFVISMIVISSLIYFAQKSGRLDAQLGIVLFLVLIIFLLIGIIWGNVKSLYASEVERFLMQEALRVNNISLEQHSNKLSSKVVELENAKKEVASKLTYQQTVSEIMNQKG